MSEILIKNGLIIDPFTGTQKIGHIIIENGIIKIVSFDLSTAEKSVSSAARVIDASGMWVTPSFVDAHCHIREPGFEYKERMKYTSNAAKAGGYTTLCVMPNLSPVIDKFSVVEAVRSRAKESSEVDISIFGAITEGSTGERLAEIGELAEAGCIGISDDGTTVMNSKIMMMGMYYAKSYNLPVSSHCEDLSLSKDGSANMGRVSTEMGVNGIPNAAEDIIISRDLLLAEMTGCKLHIAHVSTEFGVELIRIAKNRGVDVTAEATPHHFTLTDEAVRNFDTCAKMNPPLRSIRDLFAVRNGLKDGTIDIISTDHAPHAPQDKEKEFDLAPFGIVGLESSLPLCLNLAAEGLLSPMDVITKITKAPALRFGINKEGIVQGAFADITILNPNEKWIFCPDKLQGEAKNSPFFGWEFTGRVHYTIKRGKIIWEA